MSLVTKNLIGRTVAVKVKRSCLASDVQFCPLFAATLTGMAGRFAFFREVDGSEIIIAITTIADIHPVKENS